MDIFKKYQQTESLFGRFYAVTLQGRLKKFSTENLHQHDMHQVLLFKKGISLLLDAKKKQPLFDRMTAFIPAGCPHRSVTLGRQVEYKSLYLDRELFFFKPNSIRIFDMSELGLALLIKLDIYCVNEAMCKIDELQQDCLRLFIKVLREDINKRSASVRLPVAELESNKIVVGYLEEYYQEKITLKDVAALLPYTARHISRLFKEEMHISIFEYLKIYRILQASIQLKTTSKNVTEIAYYCGYNSISCFFEDFNHIFSTTPRQFKHLL